MSMRTLRAHFDGEHICLDEPCTLEPNTQLLVTVLPKQQEENGEREAWSLFSKHALSQAYGENEPEYPLDCLKERNPEYEGR